MQRIFVAGETMRQIVQRIFVAGETKRQIWGKLLSDGQTNRIQIISFVCLPHFVWLVACLALVG